jgi:hypothetical protein
LKDLDEDGKIIVKWTFENYLCDDVDWIHLAGSCN